MSLVNIGAEWEYHGITDEDDCADWMVEKMNRGRRQRERGDKQPELRGHFWIEDEGKIIDYWFKGYTMICNKLNIKKIPYYKPFNEKLQRRMINAFVNDFTPKHKELLKKYWKMTANSCDYNVCAYKLRHPSAKIIYGAMGFGDEVKYALFDNSSDDKRDYDMSVLLKKQFPNDYDKCNMIYKWVVSEANMMVNRFPKPIPVPKKKKRKRKSQRRRQKENKLKKKCDASHLIHTGTHRREATTNIKIIN
mgnify:CR=1 FL=1